MVMPKTFNGTTIHVESLRQRYSTPKPSKLTGYTEDIQRHNHPMLMPKTINGITIQYE
jgi:hypothetical protein